MAPELADWLIVLGRFLLGGFFAWGGVTHFFALDPITRAMAAHRVPSPRLVLIAGSLFQIAMGVLLALGISAQDAVGGLRLSLGRSTTLDAVDHVLDVLPPIIERMRN